MLMMVRLLASKDGLLAARCLYDAEQISIMIRLRSPSHEDDHDTCCTPMNPCSKTLVSLMLIAMPRPGDVPPPNNSNNSLLPDSLPCFIAQIRYPFNA